MKKSTKYILAFVILTLLALLIFVKLSYDNMEKESRIKSQTIRALEDEIVDLERSVNFKNKLYENSLDRLEAKENELKSMVKTKESMSEKIEALDGLVDELNNDIYRMEVALQYKPYFINDDEIDKREAYIKKLKKDTLSGHIKEGKISMAGMENAKKISRLYQSMRQNLINIFSFTYYNSDEILLIERNRDNSLLKEMSEIHEELDLSGKSERERIDVIVKYIADNYKYYIEKGEFVIRYRNIFYQPFDDDSDSDELQCMGYTNLFENLLFISGIKSRTVKAYLESSKVGHAWNEVTLSNGKKYYFDLTFADMNNKIDDQYLWAKKMDFGEKNRIEVGYMDEMSVERVR